MESIIEKRLKRLKDNFLPTLNQTKNKKVLITGANGYIGSVLSLLLRHCNACLYCLVRDKGRAIQHFKEICGDISGIFVVQELEEVSDSIDIVICCAAPTQSSFFAKNPIETLDSIYTHSKKMLDFCVESGVKKFVLLSTMEVYGDIVGENISENSSGRFDIMALRNSYPLAKQISEFMAHSYSKQYGLNCAIMRLTQTIGPTAQISDNRVYMDFIRSAMRDSKITLLTKGETKREYIDVFDVAMAIVFVMLDEKPFEIYNVANPNIFVSIYDLAKIIATKLNAKVTFDLQQDTSQYLPPLVRKLNSQKIQLLDWIPLFNLHESLEDMIYYIKEYNE